MTTTTFLCLCTLPARRSITIKWHLQCYGSCIKHCRHAAANYRQVLNRKGNDASSRNPNHKHTEAKLQKTVGSLPGKQWIFFDSLCQDKFCKGAGFFASVCSTLLHIKLLVVLSVAFLSSFDCAFKHWSPTSSNWKFLSIIQNKPKLTSQVWTSKNEMARPPQAGMFHLSVQSTAVYPSSLTLKYPCHHLRPSQQHSNIHNHWCFGCFGKGFRLRTFPQGVQGGVFHSTSPLWSHYQHLLLPKARPGDHHRSSPPQPGRTELKECPWKDLVRPCWSAHRPAARTSPRRGVRSWSWQCQNHHHCPSLPRDAGRNNPQGSCGTPEKGHYMALHLPHLPHDSTWPSCLNFIVVILLEIWNSKQVLVALLPLENAWKIGWKRFVLCMLFVVCRSKAKLPILTSIPIVTSTPVLNLKFQPRTCQREEMCQGQIGAADRDTLWHCLSHTTSPCSLLAARANEGWQSSTWWLGGR